MLQNHDQKIKEKIGEKSSIQHTKGASRLQHKYIGCWCF